MQHYVLDRFGVGLLVRGCQHFLGPPTASRGDVLHRMTLPLRRPLPPNRVPHPTTLRHDLRQPICPPQPVIEQMTIARLGRILRRREYGCLSDRRLRLLLRCQRVPHRIAHHHDLLVTLLVVLGAPVDRPGLEVDIVPDQVPPRRDPPAGSFGHDERQRKQRMYARRHLEQLEIYVVRHHRPLRVLLLGESNARERVLPQQSPTRTGPLASRPIEGRHEQHEIQLDRAVPDWLARCHALETRVALASRHCVAPHVRLGQRRHIATRAKKGYHSLQITLIAALRARLLTQVLRALQIELRRHANCQRLLVQRLLVREQGVEQLVGLPDRQLFVAVPQRLPHLPSLHVDRPTERAARAVFVQPHPGPAFADGLRPAFPVFHTFLRSLAMSWASASGSYDRPDEAASLWRSPRRTRWRPLGLARRSGMVPSRTARRIVSSQQAASCAAPPASSSASRWAWAAQNSFFRRALRAAAACSAPFSRSVVVSCCASTTKAASQGGRPSGRSTSSGRASGMLHLVLLPDALAGFGRHRPPLLVDSARKSARTPARTPLERR